MKKKNIHVKEYTRKKHGRAKFGGKVSSHNKSGRAKNLIDERFMEKLTKQSRREPIKWVSKYTIVEEGGKPSEYTAHNDNELFRILKKIGNRIKLENDTTTDVHVYRNGEDITESQFIDEMVGEIME